MMSRLLREVQDMRKSHLGYGPWTVGRDVCDWNTVLRSGFAIHNVHARGGYSNVLKFGQTLDGFSGNDSLVGNNDFGIPASLRNLLGRRAIVNLKSAQFGESIPRKVAGIEGISIQNDNFHDLPWKSSFGSSHSWFMSLIFFYLSELLAIPKANSITVSTFPIKSFGLWTIL